MNFAYNIIVFFLLALSFGAQEFLPAIEFAQYARVMLPPVFFFSTSLSVSFPVMLCFALFTGLVWDARHLPYKQEKIKPTAVSMASPELSERTPNIGGELSVGYSVVLFGMLGSLMQGIRPLFKRGRWEVPVVMVGIATAAWLLVEYLLISFLRGSFLFPHLIWPKIITDSLLAMFVAPVMLYILHTLARILNYEMRYDELAYRFHGH